MSVCILLAQSIIKLGNDTWSVNLGAILQNSHPNIEAANGTCLCIPAGDNKIAFYK